MKLSVRAKKSYFCKKERRNLLFLILTNSKGDTIGSHSHEATLSAIGSVGLPFQELGCRRTAWWLGLHEWYWVKIFRELFFCSRFRYQSSGWRGAWKRRLCLTDLSFYPVLDFVLTRLDWGGDWSENLRQGFDFMAMDIRFFDFAK